MLRARACHIVSIRRALSEYAGPGGVEIKDRGLIPRIYKSCFVGTEAVDWLMKTLRLDSREEAVLLGMLGTSGDPLSHSRAQRLSSPIMMIRIRSVFAHLQDYLAP